MPANGWEMFCAAINATGYGLDPPAFHSRIEKRHRFVRATDACPRGFMRETTYVKSQPDRRRGGVQPLYGGEGLSGTGPKAGGPHYLQRFALERTLSRFNTDGGRVQCGTAQFGDGRYLRVPPSRKETISS